MSTQFSDAGYRYQLVVRGECGPLLTGWFGEAAVEPGRGRTRISFTVRDDGELYGLLDRIQDLALHLISLNEVDGAAAIARPAEALPSVVRTGRTRRPR
jgi:hypothetical protein